MLHAVVMAGGSGTRFWPMSRAARPKQLLALATDRELIVETVDRLAGLVPAERVHIVTGEVYKDAITELLGGDVRVIAEPVGRDTAPCIGLAASLIAAEDEDAVLAVLAADHVIRPPEEFRNTLSRAAKVLAERPDSLVTFGVPPTRPATGYGYLERGDEVCRVDGVPCYRVAAFREKPDQPTAEEFVAAGSFLWNVGIFVFRARTILDRIDRYLPELAAALPEVAERYRAAGSVTTAEYSTLQKISIDYGVMEKDDDVVVLEASFAWDDVGSFAALERVLSADDKNFTVGAVTALDASDNIVVEAAGGHEVALLGVEGLIVVHTSDATLVCRKEDAERVKELVERLRADGRGELL